MRESDYSSRKRDVEQSIRHQVRALKDSLLNAAGDRETEDAAMVALTAHLLRNAIPVSLGLGVIVHIATDSSKQRRIVTNVACSFGNVVYELDHDPHYRSREDLVFFEHASQESLDAISKR